MSKPARPSLISDLLLRQQQPESPAPEMPLPPPRQTRPDIVHSSIYVPKAAYREIALARECKAHDLVLDGIDSVLREHGHPTTAELRAKAL